LVQRAEPDEVFRLQLAQVAPAKVEVMGRKQGEVLRGSLALGSGRQRPQEAHAARDCAPDTVIEMNEQTVTKPATDSGSVPPTSPRSLDGCD
jgi:hypothetical protein